MNTIFYKHVSAATSLAFDPASNQIVFTTQMYNAKTGNNEMRNVTIDEEEWQAIVKYGEEAGFSQ